jgi:hypothetical protein
MKNSYPFPSTVFRCFLLVGGLFIGALCAQQDDDQIDRDVVLEDFAIPQGLTLRARVLSISPEDHFPTSIYWRFGGQGVSSGETQKGEMGSSMEKGVWTEPLELKTLIPKKAPRLWYLGILAGAQGQLKDRVNRIYEGYSKDVEMEFEFSDGEKVLKTIRAKGVNGGTLLLVIPVYRLADGKITPEFVNELDSVLGYAEARARFAEGLPHAKEPLPSKFTVVTDLRGYGVNQGYGIFYTDPLVVEAEARTLRQLGVNALRASPDFWREMAGRGEGNAARFGKAAVLSAGGFPVVPYRKGGRVDPGAGCPFSSQVPVLTQEMLRKAKETLLSQPFPEVWALTVDEIGSVFDGTPEGKGHIAVCPDCAVAYREFLRQEGRRPEEFGKTDWAEIAPLNLWSKDPDAPKPDLSNPEVALNAYYTRRFNNDATARLFQPVRDLFAETNKQRAAAIAAGNLDSAEAKWPHVNTFALRGQTFIMRGHSLDFFEFYRHADNAFVYETSSRDARIWQWDSYFCDLGRTVQSVGGLDLGVYIKPHRGAVIQRTLASAARNFRMLYWYTYGPDYAKGDTFSNKPHILESTSQAAHLVAKAEAALYGAKWVHEPEIALVSPFTLNHLIQGEIRKKQDADLLLAAAWEDTKWTYSALSHAHLAVKPIDERFLNEQDLSKLKVIYLPSPVLRRDAAEKLMAWVREGGTLYLNAGGMTRDEAGRPFDSLLADLGLVKREAPQMWAKTPLYAGSRLEPCVEVNAPAEKAALLLSEKDTAHKPHPLTIGREVLHPAPGAEVLARFGDGAPAVTRAAYGKGWVYVAGLFPGVEYSVPLRDMEYDMTTGLTSPMRDWIARAALDAGVKPAVSSNHPLVEGLLLKQEETGGRSVALMNWGYRTSGSKVRMDKSGKRHVVSSISELVPATELEVRLRNSGAVAQAHSLETGSQVTVRMEGEDAVLSIPELREGDVIVLK